jgi:protein SERAC1
VGEARPHRPSKGGIDKENCEQYGMFTLEDKPPDATKMIDIVAVHGLNGHYLRTWSARGPDGAQVNWLRDFLPKQIPNARIMSYGYNSALQFSKSVADIFTFADQLLEALISRRVTEIEQKRPIMFICHSLGGIVFKQASRL